MTPRPTSSRQSGFSLLELLTALGIFLVICGAAFSLLMSSQQRYRTDSQLLSSFQEARLALDQIVRDVNDAGYPPPGFVAVPGGTPLNFIASSPFAWSQGAGYPNAQCQIGTAGGGNCTSASSPGVPGDFDLIIETNPNPQDPGCFPNCQVQWIRYQLQGTTLMRGAVFKSTPGDPDTSFAGAAAAVPFVQNVVNNSPNLQIGGNPNPLSVLYPAVFPGGNPVPIFQYNCDHPPLPQSPPPPAPACQNALGGIAPANIRDVMVTLIVAAPGSDANTGMPRLAQLTGRGRRINPNQ